MSASQKYPYFFTWSAQGKAQAMALQGGEGCYLIAEDGRRFLDLGSLSYQANLGHGHPAIIAAIQKQAAELCMAPPNVEFSAKRELAEELLALAPPGFSRVFFTLGGSEANENAMKLARLATGRLKFVSRYRSYHGATMGALALTGDYRRPPLEPLIGGVVHVLGDDARYLEEVMELEGEGSIAAVFMEPIPGANGVLLPPEDYWPRMRAACDRHGALLVADEVLTGFGRTGHCFGFEAYGVVPDMITVAKALTGGYAPLGAVLVHERVASHFDEAILYAGLTNYAHPLGCAAGLAALREYRARDLYTRAAALEDRLLEPLRALCRTHPEVFANARGRGFLAAIDVKADSSMWRSLSQNVEAAGLLVHLYPGRGYIVVSPPLNIDAELLDEGMQRFSEAATRSLASGGQGP